MRTIDSVVRQTSRSWEMCISDNSRPELQLRLREAIGLHKERIRLVSTEDKGIFDAMNKGANAAQGEYLLFLNGGDRLHDERVVEEFEARYRTQGTDMVFGNVIGQDPATGFGRRRSAPPCLSALRLGYSPPHQGMFIGSTFWRKAGHYNVERKVAGDFEWLLRAAAMSPKIEVWARDVAWFDLSGVSTFKPSLQERERCGALLLVSGRWGVACYLPWAAGRLVRGYARMALHKVGCLQMWRRIKGTLTGEV